MPCEHENGRGSLSLDSLSSLSPRSTRNLSGSRNRNPKLMKRNQAERKCSKRSSSKRDCASVPTYIQVPQMYTMSNIKWVPIGDVKSLLPEGEESRGYRYRDLCQEGDVVRQKGGQRGDHRRRVCQGCGFEGQLWGLCRYREEREGHGQGGARGCLEIKPECGPLVYFMWITSARMVIGGIAPRVKIAAPRCHLRSPSIEPDGLTSNMATVSSMIPIKIKSAAKMARMWTT